MPRPPSRLANCYVPLMLNTEIASSLRTDRKTDELRQLCLEIGVLSEPAIGSSLVELGHTKVLCQVSLSFSHPDATPDMGCLDCKVQFAPHIGIAESVVRSQSVLTLDSAVSAGKFHSDTMTKESSLSIQLHSALVSVLKLEDFPKCALMVHVIILQDDGSVLSTCIAAASLALADARVEMLDFVTSCTVAVIETERNGSAEADGGHEHEPVFLADPTEAERSNATAVICLAMTPNQKEVTLWSQSGRLNAIHANHAINLCRSGCRTIHKFMREVWVSQGS
jgi:ribonuclease PH